MHINLHVNCCKTAAGRHQQTRARSFTLEKENVGVFYVLLCSATTWYCCIFLATQTYAHIDEHTPRKTHTTARARTTLARHSPASSEKRRNSENWSALFTKLTFFLLSLSPSAGRARRRRRLSTEIVLIVRLAAVKHVVCSTDCSCVCARERT